MVRCATSERGGTGLIFRGMLRQAVTKLYGTSQVDALVLVFLDTAVLEEGFGMYS